MFEIEIHEVLGKGKSGPHNYIAHFVDVVGVFSCLPAFHKLVFDKAEAAREAFVLAQVPAAAVVAAQAGP